ncbi:DMT family transporter [Psychromicrobium xiongbiense]|uniref:DMT family transporter n=1 Tax=Psychromicrobium xiongbiense TaxID=3051184 RepID=UPI0025568DAA|nr:DMT family transporter [Psychromicrobium sp. YIM S02556]
MNAFLAAIAVLGVAASGPIMAATAAPALAIAFWRNALGAVLMGVPAVVRERQGFRQLNRRETLWCLVAGGVLALHFACFITALQLTSVAGATALVCLQSAWIVLFHLMRGQKQAPAIFLGLLLAVAGVLVITGLDLGGSSKALLGDLLGVAGGVFAAAYTLAGARARSTLSTGVYTTLCYGACALFLVIFALCFRVSLVDFPPVAWIGILAVTVVAQILGHSVFNYLLASLGALVVSMLILLEIPGAALLAALFLGERLPAGTYVGLVLIVAGLAVVIRQQSRTPKV